MKTLLIGKSTRTIDFKLLEIEKVIESTEIINMKNEDIQSLFSNFRSIIITSYLYQNKKINIASTVDFTKRINDAITNNQIVIFLSSDAVFSGERGKYTVNDIPDPDTSYGLAKYKQELILSNHNIIRFTTIGPSYSKRKLLYELVKDKEAIRLYPNHFFSPISTVTLNTYIHKLIKSKVRKSLNHLASERLSKAECILNLQRKTYLPFEENYTLSSERKDLSLINSTEIKTSINEEINKCKKMN